MKWSSLLSILALLQARRISSSVGGASEATIDASGEASVPIDPDADEGASDAEYGGCEPADLLGGRLSSCDSFRIATLNASPRRCVHIDSPPPSNDDEKQEDIPQYTCKDRPNWSDGTNGCSAYRSNSDFCAKYGHWDFPSTPYNANEACCVCGGGTRTKLPPPPPPRLKVGEYVRLKGFGNYDQCSGSLKIVKIGRKPRFHYQVEVTKACGPKRYAGTIGGRHAYEDSFKAGHKFSVDSDNPNMISEFVRVELKRCRAGAEEQEFRLKQISEEEGHNILLIEHKLTGIDLTYALDAKGPHVNATQVFEDDAFEGSEEYYYLKLVTNENRGRMNSDGTPYGPTWGYLASGHFGEKEYSLVQTHALASKRGFDEQEFSMWRFQPVTKDDSSDAGSAAVDEHAQWLIRMTHMIGIDYLVQLPPWHLLDVEREASKGDVKSRFRELSRYFHPDKLLESEKKELYERIFVMLQNAYQGLKSADEKEKEKFRVEAESGSQLFAHSQYVVELLPFHWSRLDDDNAAEDEGASSGRFVLNAASHLNSTLLDDDSSLEESEPSVQLWVTYMYSARCGMSRTVGGMVDLAARHLEQFEGIKVGAYGCGLYPEYPASKTDVLGVTSDPICGQFNRRETPNVHVIVETIPGRKRDEDGNWVEVPPDTDAVRENAKFDYFYTAAATGNTTQFYPHNFIDFALAGARVWRNSHLVRKMTGEDFLDPNFVKNVSIVAFMDGTGNGETNQEVVDAISNSLPGVARRFLNDDVYVGVANCGYGDDASDQEETEAPRNVDCSKLDVSWLPDIKVYAVDDTAGFSLLRGHFSDMRDVQIALESMGNVLRMMLGGTDDDFEDEFEEIKEEEDTAEQAAGGCDNKQRPPPPPEYDLDLDEIDGRMEETPLLESQKEEKADKTKPALDNESKPALGQSTDDKKRKPKLASGADAPRLDGGREKVIRDRVSGFHQRQVKQNGGGRVLGGGGGGAAGFIA